LANPLATPSSAFRRAQTRGEEADVMVSSRKTADPDWSDIGQSEEDAGARHGEGTFPIGCLAHDPTERLALDVMRFVCAGFATGDAEHWDAAHDLAEECLGLIDGPSLVARGATLLRAVRSDRTAPFQFLSAKCPDCREHISRCEAQLMALVRLARRGPSAILDRRASSFAGRREAPHIVLAACAMGMLLERY
jgi:hypothetical protein